MGSRGTQPAGGLQGHTLPSLSLSPSSTNGLGICEDPMTLRVPRPQEQHVLREGGGLLFVTIV